MKRDQVIYFKIEYPSDEYNKFDIVERVEQFLKGVYPKAFVWVKEK